MLAPNSQRVFTKCSADVECVKQIWALMSCVLPIIFSLGHVAPVLSILGHVVLCIVCLPQSVSDMCSRDEFFSIIHMFLLCYFQGFV